MQFTSILPLSLWASSFSIVIAAPSPTRATVNFTPYEYVGCRQSQNPYSTAQPVSYNLTTSSGCVTPPYAFASYVEGANSAAANGSCSLSLYSNPKCKGTVSAGVISPFYQCETDNNAGGQSVRLTCGH